MPSGASQAKIYIEPTSIRVGTLLPCDHKVKGTGDQARVWKAAGTIVLGLPSELPIRKTGTWQACNIIWSDIRQSKWLSIPGLASQLSVPQLPQSIHYLSLLSFTPFVTVNRSGILLTFNTPPSIPLITSVTTVTGNCSLQHLCCLCWKTPCVIVDIYILEI